MRLSLLLLALAALPAPAAPRPVLRPPLKPVTAAPVYQWRAFPADTSQIALWELTPRGWQQVGGYSFDTETYHPRISAGNWGPVCNAPTEPPQALRLRHRRRHPRPRPRMNFGLDLDRMPVEPAGRTIYRDHTGREITREQALRLLHGKGSKKSPPAAPQRPPQAAPKKPGSSPALPDDAKKPFFATGGTPAKYASILAALDASGQRDRFRVQAYDMTGDARLNWPVTRGKFPTSDPFIVIEKADGTEVSRTEGDPGQDGMARLLASPQVLALWEPDPNYDPAKTPDLSQPSLLPALTGPGGVHLVAGGLSVATLAAGGLILALRRRKKLA